MKNHQKKQQEKKKKNNFRILVDTLWAERTLKESNPLFTVNYPLTCAQNSIYWQA